MQKIQSQNGELGCHRYIISNNQTSQNIFEVFAMIRLSNWESPSVDVAPLFETISDLSIAPKVMDVVYSDPTYRNHLRTRDDKQTIMLGFSDGTKDGGYSHGKLEYFSCQGRTYRSVSESMALKHYSSMVGEDHQHVGVETHINSMRLWATVLSRTKFKLQFKVKRLAPILERLALVSTT